jgi:hypothetical protein
VSDLDTIIRVTTAQIEKRRRAYFSFWRCEHCDFDLFHVFNEGEVWLLVCDFCHEKYGLLADGTIELLREGDELGRG